MALVKYDPSEFPRDRDRQSMIAYEALIFPVFLIAVTLGRLLPRSGSKAQASRSAFAEAAERTESVVPWFFVHQ